MTILNSPIRKRFDFQLLLFAYLLAAIGVLMAFSATRDIGRDNAIKHILFLLVSTGAMFAFTLIDFHFYPRIAKTLYITNLCQLILVLFFRKVNGINGWIQFGPLKYQPAETAKIIIILTLGAFLVYQKHRIREPRVLGVSFVLVLVPILLILLQPDLGTALVFFCIWFGMTFIAGANWKHLLLVLVTGLVLGSTLIVTGIGMKQHTKERLEVFVGIRKDNKKAGYHTKMVRIAIGSGGLFGKGLMRSTQISGGFVPEHETDFIFTVIAEELGFVGCLVVIVLYTMLIYRGILIAGYSNEDLYGKLVATGIVCLIGFHTIQNIGMNVGVMPVTGIPLLLISYGGSSLLTTFICLGILESISIRRHKLAFE